MIKSDDEGSRAGEAGAPSGASAGGEPQVKLTKYLGKGTGIGQEMRAGTGDGSKCERIRIIVDHREAHARLVGELLKLGVEVEFRSLKVGDYAVSESVAIERKRYDDFAGSIVDRRLFEQLRALREAYSRPVLLLEMGEPLTRAVSREALRGAIVSVILDFGVPILWAEGSEESAKLLVTIAKREQRGGGSPIPLKDRRRPTTPDGEGEYIVASLPFVEATTAKRLLAEFGSVERVFTAGCDDLMKVEGIGVKKARRIREAVTRKYGCGPGGGENNGTSAGGGDKGAEGRGEGGKGGGTPLSPSSSEPSRGGRRGGPGSS